MAEYKFDVDEIPKWIKGMQEVTNNLLTQKENIDSAFLQTYIEKINVAIGNLNLLGENLSKYLHESWTNNPQYKLDLSDNKIETYSTESINILLTAKSDLQKLSKRISSEGRNDSFKACKKAVESINEIIKEIETIETRSTKEIAEEYLIKIQKAEITREFDLPRELQTLEFYEKVVKNKPSFLDSVAGTGDSTFMKRMIASNPETLNYANHNLFSDKNFILFILSKCPDETVYLIGNKGTGLPWIDKNFACAAVATNAKAIKLVENFNPDLLKDKEFKALCDYAQNPTRENYNLTRDRLDLRKKSIHDAFLKIAVKSAGLEMMKQKGVKSLGDLKKVEDFKKNLKTTVSEIKKDINQRTNDLVSGKASLTEDARQTEKKAEESERTEQKAKKPEQTEQESEEPERTEQESGGNSGRQNIERKAYSTEDFAMQDSDGRLRKKFDINNENEMNQLLVFYAQMNVAYYNKKDRTDEEVKVRRRINAQFKRIIDKKATALINGENNEESNFEQKIQEINNGTMFTSGDIEEIAKSKGATIKLFQIMSSGVYEKDGIRTRLSQKQRCALANVLQKVSEKKLDTENAKLGEKGKKDKTSDGVVKVSEIGG